MQTAAAEIEARRIVRLVFRWVVRLVIGRAPFLGWVVAWCLDGRAWRGPSLAWSLYGRSMTAAAEKSRPRPISMAGLKRRTRRVDTARKGPNGMARVSFPPTMAPAMA